MTTELPESTCLQRGQTLRMAVDAGFALRVAQGSVDLSGPPSWLGESVFSVRTRLEEGQVHVVERGGWIEVRALAPARVGPVAMPAADGPAAASRLARLVQLLAGRVAWR
ncbi:hypothetical protein [Variovorax saccharolyticus]|uniref:hypothetical protein n=1 Tax=Variovorax saccharolyticus TaxID=3053516 RepID=UPI0025789A00|nr:hypothetical protein [Variovorax sp. J31P216]MDM0024756.1 hypothetical protein [Variovorax sp. J31P216]